MATVLRSGPHRFFFYSADGNEPPHVHVERDDSTAKFWLEPVRLQESYRLRPTEIDQIERIIQANVTLLVKNWHEFFGN
jgi:hypothetical protein